MPDLIPIEKTSNESLMTASPDDQRYPYGTSLTIEGEMVEKLGLESLATGDVVMLKAQAFVESKSQYERTESNGEGQSDKTVCIQLTSMKVSREELDRVQKLYGEQS